MICPIGITQAQALHLILKTSNMANMKTGLSYFEDGGEVQPPVAPLSKPVTPKGRYGVASPIGSVPMNESVLENMQKLLEQKQAQQGSFLERLKDVKSVFTGSGATQAQAMDTRNKQRQEQSSDIFQIQNQLAQQKAAQAQLANIRAEDEKSGWGRPQAGGAATPGEVTPGTAPAPIAGGPEADVVQQYNRILYTQGIAEANKFKNKYLEEKSKARLNPNLDPIIEFPLEGVLTPMKTSQAQRLAERDPVLQKYLQQIAPTASAPAAATPIAKPPVAAAPITPIDKPPAPVSAAPTAPVSAAPKAPAPALGGNRSISGIKAQLEVDKEVRSTVGKERVKNEEERLATLREVSRKALEREDTANRIDAIAKEDPEMYGVLVTPGIGSTIGTLLKEGIKVGTHGQIALPSVEDMARRVGPNATPEKLSRVREMDGYLRKVELDFSSAFKGQGAVSDNERKIVQAIAGSTSDPADLLRKKAAWLKMSAQKDKALGTAWKEFRQKYGEDVRFGRFEDSKEYQQIISQHEQNLRKQFESEVRAYGNRPLVSAEEYDKGVVGAGKTKGFVPSESQKATFEKYKKKN